MRFMNTRIHPDVKSKVMSFNIIEVIKLIGDIKKSPQVNWTGYNS